MEILQPGYKMPNPQVFRARLELAYDQVRGMVEDVLRKSSALTLTTDEWISRAQVSYLSVTSHYIDENWNLRSFHVCTEATEDRPTTENLASILQPFSVRVLGDVKHSIKCSARTLQLSIKDALKSAQEYRTVCDKVSHVVSHFKHSVVAYSALQTKQIQFGLNHGRLIQSCPTWWDSTFMVCDTCLRNRSPINAVLADRVHAKAYIAPKFEICESDWSLLEEPITLLKPLNAASQ
ncbi:hypothetical protein PR048_002263, partial [Dryococelus australis]